MIENTNENEEINNITPDNPEEQIFGPGSILSIFKDILICISMGMFILSPIIQLFIRFFGRSKISRHQYPDLVRYQTFIDTTNKLVIFAAIAVFIGLVCYEIYGRITDNSSSILSIMINKAGFNSLAPYIIFIAFALGIIIVTLIRGSNDWDMTGHWYTHESMFSYITYALAYFFCGMLLFSERTRKLLLYLLIFSALPLHILALVNEWGNHIVYFDAQGLSNGGVTTVFFNSNHYGYYLTITILASALMYVYEQKTGLRVISAICGIIGTMVLIINDTLGAYLATLFVLILFIAYCLFLDRKNRSKAITIFLAYIIITIAMSFHYNTILSSLFVLSDDVGQIIADPTTADSAGSSRWLLWKGTVKHMPEHPLVGFGVEGLLLLYDIGTPHNELLQYAEFFGIPVMLLYIAACALVLWRVFRNSKKLSSTTMICFFVCIGYLASSFFGVAIFYTTPFFYIMLGLTYAEYLKNAVESASSAGIIDGTDATDNAGIEYDKEIKENANIKDNNYEKGYSDGYAEGLKEGAMHKLTSIVCIKLQRGEAVEDIANELEEEPELIEGIRKASENEHDQL